MLAVAYDRMGKVHESSSSPWDDSEPLHNGWEVEKELVREEARALEHDKSGWTLHAQHRLNDFVGIVVDRVLAIVEWDERK